MTFESFCRVLAETYLKAIARDLEPSEGARRVWASVERLHWVGLIREQESFYLSTSFGELASPNELVQRNISRPSFDYLESTRLSESHYPGVDVGALGEAHDQLLSMPCGWVGADADEDERREARDEARQLVVMIALGLLAVRLKRDPGVLGVTTASDFDVTVSDDLERPTRGAKVAFLAPSLAADTARRQAMLDCLCETEEAKTLVRAVLEAAEREDSTELVAVIETLAPPPPF